MPRSINKFFSLTKWVDVVLTRSTGVGDYSATTGKFIPAAKTQVTIIANVQPMKFSHVMMMDSAQRTKEWLNIWSESEIKKMQEGSGGWESDTFIWNGKRFKVMDVQQYKMGVLDHYHAKAALDSPTPAGA